MAKQLDYHTIYAIFDRFRDNEPEPVGELNHTNAYTLVVAVALSAQATDAGVNKATDALFKIVDSPEKRNEVAGTKSSQRQRQRRECHLIKSSRLPPGRAVFVIAASGIRDMNHRERTTRRTRSHHRSTLSSRQR